MGKKGEKIMKYHGDRKYLHWGMTASVVVCVGIAFYYILFHGTRLGAMVAKLFHICFPIIAGFILAYLFTPIINTIEYHVLIPLHSRITHKKEWKRKQLMRALSIFITYLLVFFSLYGLFAMIIPELVNSIANIIEQLQIHGPKTFNKYYDKVIDYLEKNETIADFLRNSFSFDVSEVNSQEVINWLLKHIENIGSFVSTLSTTIFSALKTTLNIAIGIIISIYLIYGKETYAAQIKKLCYSLFEMHNANRLIKDCRFVHKTFIGFISGKIFDSIIIGLLCFIGTTLIGLHYPVLISVTVGVTNVIPFFGPYLGAIPCAFLLLLIAPIEALYFLIFILILQQIDGNIIGPSILGNSTGISGFWVIFAITFFGGIYGVMGMVIGVPVFAVIYAFTKRFVNRRLKAKSLPLDTNLYRDAYEIRDGEFITKEHLYTEIKNPKANENKNAAEDAEKYHFFKNLFKKIQAHDSAKESEDHIKDDHTKVDDDAKANDAKVDDDAKADDAKKEK